MTAARTLGAYILVLTAAASHASDSDRPPVQPKQDEAVILFLLDNSASLPPLDPNTRRRDAIEMVYSFLRGQPYRLVLFGGREDIYVDQPQRYRNSGQWTDFFFAFQAAKELTGEYPEGTEFKIVFITDGKIDPSPREWSDQVVPKGADLREEAGNRTVRFLEELGIPLFVILIGEEVDYELIQRMVVAANGSIAGSEYSQGIAEFFGDDGVLLRRFVFRVEKHEGLDVLEPIVTRIATPPAPKVELMIAGSLLVVIGMLIGVGVRSFPGPGDREIMELWTGESLQIAVDRLRHVSSDVAAWSWKGLSLVESLKSASAVMTARDEATEMSPRGFRLDALDKTARVLIQLPLRELRARLEHLSREGTKDEQIYALNLEYVARDLNAALVERLITSAPSKRSKFAPLDFLRAKVRLLHDDKLYKKLTGPYVTCKIYGPKSKNQDLRPGSKIQLGRYGFRVDELKKGGRKDYRLGLTYEKVPSPLFLKRLVPGFVQRALRLRRSHKRIIR